MYYDCCSWQKVGYTVFAWLDATPRIVATLRRAHNRLWKWNNGLNNIFPYQMVVKFKQSLHRYLGLR